MGTDVTRFRSELPCAQKNKQTKRNGLVKSPINQTQQRSPAGAGDKSQPSAGHRSWCTRVKMGDGGVTVVTLYLSIPLFLAPAAPSLSTRGAPQGPTLYCQYNDGDPAPSLLLDAVTGWRSEEKKVQV